CIGTHRSRVSDDHPRPGAARGVRDSLCRCTRDPRGLNRASRSGGSSRLARPAAAGKNSSAITRIGRPHRLAAFAVGTLHGLAASSHLLGILPALALPSTRAAGAYLLCFCSGGGGGGGG